MPRATAVAVSVHYDVGFRSEPQGRSGFAHLFEHLMFQGSEHHPKMGHWKYVQALGGIVNGSTHQDYTDYYQLLPLQGLEQVLAMEADRMAALLVTEENLSNQCAVVKEEIRLNIRNRAYGGFPWIPLPALLYRTYPNSHDGYGTFDDLDSVTVDDAVDFYDTYYVPANAVLTVAGAVDTSRTGALVERYFGGLHSTPRPELPVLEEPPHSRTRYGHHADAHAPLPALAVGHRLPDARVDLDAYVAHMVLCEILTGGGSSRLHERLIRDRELAVHVAAGCGLFNPLDARAPDTLAAVVTHRPGVTAEAVLREVDEELALLADADTTARCTPVARVRLAARTHRRNADLLTRTRCLGAYELLHGRHALVDELPARIGAADPDMIADAALSVLTTPRALLRLVPGEANADERTVTPETETAHSR